MTGRGLWAAPVAMTALVAGLAAWMWTIRPESAVAWALAAGFLPAALVVGVGLRRAGLGDAAARQLAGAVFGAGVILAVALGAKLGLALDLIGDDGSRRLTGALLGAVLVVVGNGIPKTRPARCHGADAGPRLLRFGGWAFVIAGLAYIAVWLVAPMDAAGPIATATCAAAVVLVLVRAGWSLRRRPGPGPRDADPDPSRLGAPGGST